MLSKSFRRTSFIIVAVWLGIMAYLFGIKNREFIRNEIDVSKLGNISGLVSGNTEYLGVYYGDKKIGYVLSRTEKSENKLIISHRSELNVTVQGLKRKASVEGQAELTKDMLLSSFYFKLNTENQEFMVTGRSENNKLLIKSNLEGFSQLEIDNSSPVFLDIGINRYIARKSLSHTKRFSFRVFSLEGFSTDMVEVEVLGQKRIKIMEEEVYANHIRKKYRNFVVDSYIDLNGKTLMEKNEMGFTLVREDPENINTGYDSLDIVSRFSIVPDKAIPDIFGLSELKIRISGVDTDEGLEGGRQSLTGGVLTVKSERIHREQEKISEEDLGKYTGPEPFIQSNSAEIISLAKKISEGAKNSSEVLERINDYLFTNIRKKNVIGIPDAATTLKNMEGDCNEHTMLFVALARSLGIPARPAAGVAYLNGRFYFHAWAEAFTDRWRTYDPTWGQSPADVGHIRLVSGGMDKILDIAKYINKLKIEVTEWK